MGLESFECNQQTKTRTNFLLVSRGLDLTSIVTVCAMRNRELGMKMKGRRK